MVAMDRPKILLVDDDEEDFMIIRSMFSDFPNSHFELEWTSSYNEAVEAIRKQAHAAYLVDHRLGEKTGLDLITETKAAVPFILLTGQGDHELDVEAMKRGAYDYLVKSRIEPASLGALGSLRHQPRANS